MHRIRSRWEAVPTVTVEKVKSIRSRSHTQVLRRSSTRFAVTALVLATFGLASCSVSSKGTTSTTRPSKPAANGVVPSAGMPYACSDATDPSSAGSRSCEWLDRHVVRRDEAPSVLVPGFLLRFTPLPDCPGWGPDGARRHTSLSAAQLFGGLSIDTLHSAGFNVMTWDPRGFGASGGLVGLDSYSYEARECGATINLAGHDARLDSTVRISPRSAWSGTYGGGIQFTLRRSTAGSMQSCPRSHGTHSARASSRTTR